MFHVEHSFEQHEGQCVVFWVGACKMFHVEHFASAYPKNDALPFVLFERMFHVEHFPPRRLLQLPTTPHPAYHPSNQHLPPSHPSLAQLFQRKFPRRPPSVIADHPRRVLSLSQPHLHNHGTHHRSHQPDRK